MPGQMLAAGGPWALLAGALSLGITAIFRGWLIPRGTIRYERELLAQRADDWKEAHGVSEKAREVQSKQLAEILDAVKPRAVP